MRLYISSDAGIGLRLCWPSSSYCQFVDWWGSWAICVNQSLWL